ncbi:MAG: GNAT family N-acetyltransferase [Chloroflexota bacterium]
MICNLNPDIDIPGLHLLRLEIEAVDKHGSDTSMEGLEKTLARPDINPSRDYWIMKRDEEADALIGYGQILEQSSVRSIIQVSIHPSWRRQKLGTRLLNTIIQVAKERGATQIVSGAWGNNKTGHPFLVSNGFEQKGHNRFMTAPENSQIEPPEWPTGYFMRSYAELKDLNYLVEGSNLCYRDMWGHLENTELVTVGHFQELMETLPDYYFPPGIFVLFGPNDRVAGICFNRLEDEHSKRVIDSPGIAPAYRHLDLHRPLVQASMKWLSTQASGPFHLYTWGDFDEAVLVYEDLGFRYTESDHLIEYLLVNDE